MANEFDEIAANEVMWRALRDHVTSNDQWTALHSIGPRPMSLADHVTVCIGKRRWKVLIADMGEMTGE